MDRFLKNILALLMFAMLVTTVTAQQQRFPKPEFETGYVQPSPTTPEPGSNAMQYMDVLLLLGAMGLASYFAIKKRSRKGLLWLSVGVLIYFGFYREGCICSVGSVQNIALTLSDPGYAISIPTILFFTLPLLFALFYGRVFCAGACPLGAIQDLLIVKPLSLPLWLRKTLGLLPYLYLGLAVLYAATGTDFIICRFDPFVGIFRLSAPFHMILLGVSILLIGLFVARPYCRFLCPYGVLLKWTSFFSKKHLSITPAECIKCELCAQSCPFDAINKPSDKNKPVAKERNKFATYLLLVPVLMILFGFLFSQAHVLLSKAHPKVQLAERLIENPSLMENSNDVDIEAFMSSGTTLEQLIAQAESIRSDFYVGSWLLGLFMGLVIALTLLNIFKYRTSEIYEPHRGDCYSCGRCFKYCPVKPE